MQIPDEDRTYLLRRAAQEQDRAAASVGSVAKVHALMADEYLRRAGRADAADPAAR